MKKHQRSSNRIFQVGIKCNKCGSWNVDIEIEKDVVTGGPGKVGQEYTSDAIKLTCNECPETDYFFVI